MKKLGLALALSLVAFSAKADEFNGFVSSEACVRERRTTLDEECAKSTVSRGARPVFVRSDDRTFLIADGDEDRMRDYAGYKVTISGQIDGDRVRIESVKRN